MGCPYCKAVLGFILKDIQKYASYNNEYYSKCIKCEMNFSIPKELIPYGVKLSLKKSNKYERMGNSLYM